MIKAKAGTPYPKYFKAFAVILMFSSENVPYPNSALTISFDANDFDPTIGALIGVIDVDITGSGAIVSDSNGNLSLALSFEILGTPQSSNCEITFSR